MSAHSASSVALLPPPPISVDAYNEVGASGEADEPLSPMARIFHDICIVCVVGLAKPIDFSHAYAGLEVTLLRHPRFCSIRVMDGPEPRWVRTRVNLEDHVIVPELDRAAISANPDKVLEDYMASLSTLPMDQSRPLWELHFLDFPTSEAASAVVFRIHHALGDGASLVSLLLACTRSVADPRAVPSSSTTTPARRPGVGAPPRPALFAAWVLSCALLAWHTVVDVASFVAMALGLVRDPRTVFTGVKGVEFRRKRFVFRTLSLDDVKLVKNALGCTVNDVLVGVTSAALSRYYFRKLSGHHNKGKGTCVRCTLFVNLRPTPGIQKLAKMMESSKHNDWKWGNRVGYIMVPFEIAMHGDPLDYVRNAKKTVDRKKRSLGAIFTHAITETVTKLFGIKVSAALFYRLISSTTMQFSNVIGPSEQIEFYGHPVVYIAPSVFGHPSALTIHWQSYMDTIKVILAVDDARCSDSHDLLDDFAESLEIIRDATGTSLNHK